LLDSFDLFGYFSDFEDFCESLSQLQLVHQLLRQTTEMSDGERVQTTSGVEFVPPKVWVPPAKKEGKFGSINRPTSGATHEKELAQGKHPLQLYSLGTPNGVKVTVLLEELLALGHHGAEYDAWIVNIEKGDQFSSGFVSVNPNSKIPALNDVSTSPPTRGR
jgi:GSH-dependent disulfide-bond oxidoreductase